MKYTYSYIYPDFEFWVKYLNKPEIAYIYLYSWANQKPDGSRHIGALAPVVFVDGTSARDIELDGEYRDISMCLGFEDEDKPYIWVEGNYKGKTDYRERENTLEDLSVESITIFMKESDKGNDVTSEMILKEDVDFKLQDLYNLAQTCFEEKIDPINVTFNTPQVQFSPKLNSKIKKILIDHKTQINNDRAAKSFGI
jgi:hypothetical protein